MVLRDALAMIIHSSSETALSRFHLSFVYILGNYIHEKLLSTNKNNNCRTKLLTKAPFTPVMEPDES